MDQHDHRGHCQPNGATTRCPCSTISRNASSVASQSIRVGDQELDQRIVAHLKRTHQVLISEHSVERVKVMGSVRPDARNLQIEIRGRDLASGTLRSLRLTGQQIHDLLERPITRIIEATKDTLAAHPAAARRRRRRPRDHRHGR